jgi:hypothetical protein
VFLSWYPFICVLRTRYPHLLSRLSSFLRTPFPDFPYVSCADEPTGSTRTSPSRGTATVSSAPYEPVPVDADLSNLTVAAAPSHTHPVSAPPVDVVGAAPQLVAHPGAVAPQPHAPEPPEPRSPLQAGTAAAAASDGYGMPRAAPSTSSASSVNQLHCSIAEPFPAPEPMSASHPAASQLNGSISEPAHDVVASQLHEPAHEPSGAVDSVSLHERAPQPVAAPSHAQACAPTAFSEPSQDGTRSAQPSAAQHGFGGGGLSPPARSPTELPAVATSASGLGLGALMPPPPPEPMQPLQPLQVGFATSGVPRVPLEYPRTSLAAAAAARLRYPGSTEKTLRVPSNIS